MTTNPGSMSGLKYRITWEEWREQWDRATDVHARIGLLHSGFAEVGVDYSTENAERICFYFQIAEKDFRNEGLSNKALSMLIQHVFGQFGHRGIIGFPPSVLEAACIFFRTEPNPDPASPVELKFPNLWRVGMSQVVEEKLYACAHELAKNFWDGTKYNPYKKHAPYRRETDELFRQKRILGLEMLVALGTRYRLEGGKIHTLMPEPGCGVGVIRSIWRMFDNVALARLKEIVLLRAKSIEAGVVANSEAAKMYLLASTALKEIERQEAVEAAQEKIKEAQRELEKIK